MDTTVEITTPNTPDRLRFSIRCPDPLTNKDVQYIREMVLYAVNKIKVRFRRRGLRVVWTFQNYETSMFWYIVLHRPLRFLAETETLRDGLTVAGMMNPEGAAALRLTDQGVILDMERNWLLLLWNEACRTGVLKDLRKIPLWTKTLTSLLNRSEAAIERMSDERLDRIAQNVALNTPFLVPKWSLHRIGYFSDKLFWVDRKDRENIIVYNLAGASVATNDIGEDDFETLREHPTDKARFAHLYTVNKAEFREAMQNYRSIQRKIAKNDAHTKKREKEREDYRNFVRSVDKWNRGKLGPETAREISLTIQDLASHLGFSRRGRRIKYLDADESRRMMGLCAKNILLRFGDGEDKQDVLKMNDVVDGVVAETREIDWTESLVQRIRYHAENIDALCAATEAGAAYYLWGGLKNVDETTDSIVSWARETLLRYT